MSRKSKRRRTRHTENAPQSPGVGDGFEFLDDRGNLPGDVGFVPVAAPAAAASQASRATASDARATAVAVADAPAPVEAAAAAAAVATAPPPVPEPAAAEPVETLGEILTTARQARGLSIEEASARTRIAAKMLQHLENDRFGEFAAEAYVRGFLRSYGALLGVDVAMLLARYETLLGHTAEPVTAQEWTADVEPPRPLARVEASNRRSVFVVVAIAGLAVLTGIGVVLSQRGFELRPAAGLSQIEDELKASQDAASVPATAPAPAPPSGDAAVPAPLAASPQDPPSAAAGTVVAPPPAAPANAASGFIVSRAAEDTAPRLPVSDALQRTGGLDDLVEGPLPAAGAPTGVADASPGTLPDDGTLLLTATARDSCTLRLQIDTDARHAQRYIFTQAGESRAWTAKSSFRILAGNAAQLELRLNGRLVPVLADGRTVVLDRRTLQSGQPGVPGRTRRSGRRVRRSHAQAPAPTSAAANPAPENAAGPP